jgi:hypothetical protein
MLDDLTLYPLALLLFSSNHVRVLIFAEFPKLKIKKKLNNLSVANPGVGGAHKKPKNPTKKIFKRR